MGDRARSQAARVDKADGARAGKIVLALRLKPDDPHISQECRADFCRWPGFDIDGSYEVEVNGQPYTFHGCPIQYRPFEFASPFLSFYRMLNKWSITPVALGIPPERIDPRAFEAAEIIDNELALQREQERGN